MPPHLLDLLYLYSLASKLRSSELNLLAVPLCQLSTEGGRFGVIVPKLWNALPLTLRNISHLSIPLMYILICILDNVTSMAVCVCYLWECRI